MLHINEWFSKIGCLDFLKKKLGRKSYFEFFVESPTYTNPNLPLNLYQANICCILLEEQSQRPIQDFTNSTELKSSFPFPGTNSDCIYRFHYDLCNLLYEFNYIEEEKTFYRKMFAMNAIFQSVAINVCLFIYLL